MYRTIYLKPKDISGISRPEVLLDVLQKIRGVERLELRADEVVFEIEINDDKVTPEDIRGAIGEEMGIVMQEVRGR